LTAPTAKLFPRFVTDQLTAALKDTPVVMVNGPRQCGKTTMVRAFASKKRTYVTLDDDTVLESVRNDPSGLPRVEQGVRSVELRASGLAMILDGIDVSKLKSVPRYSRAVGSSQ